MPCEIKGEKVITVGQKTLLQCVLDDSQKGQTYEFQVADAPDFSLQFLGAPQVKEKILEQEITSYKVGTYKFEKINLRIDQKTFQLPVLDLEVKTVITEPSPTPYPLIPAQEIAAPWWWWVMWGAILLSLMFYAFMSYKKWQKRRWELANQPKAKVYTPFERFKLNLQKLESQEFHLKGEYKRFALDLSQIIKKAIGEKLGFPADDLTTEELFETLSAKHSSIWNSVESFITSSFTQLDQIKFAKTPATAEMCMSLLDVIRQVGEALYKEELK